MKKSFILAVLAALMSFEVLATHFTYGGISPSSVYEKEQKEIYILLLSDGQETRRVRFITTEQENGQYFANAITFSNPAGHFCGRETFRVQITQVQYEELRAIQTSLASSNSSSSSSSTSSVVMLASDQDGSQEETLQLLRERPEVLAALAAVIMSAARLQSGEVKSNR